MNRQPTAPRSSAPRAPRGARLPLLGLLAVPALAAAAAGQVEHLSLSNALAGSGFGYAVASAGDVDLDGTPDYMIGSPYASVGGTNTGIVYVSSGKNNQGLAIHPGTVNNQYLGSGLAGGVDVNQDGWPDYLVGSERETVGAKPLAGGARLYSGKTHTVMFTWTGADNGEFFGASLAFVGDVNGDGWEDVAIGSLAAKALGVVVGGVRVHSGLNGSLIRSHSGTFLNQGFGIDVCAAGDWDADGFADYAISATHLAVQGDNGGRAEVYSGATGASLFLVTGAPNQALGRAIETADDVNGDGSADLAVTIKGFGGTFGAVRIYAAGTGAEIITIAGQNPGDAIGDKLAAIGDVDRDGLGDLLVSNTAMGSFTGQARVYSSATGLPLWNSMNGAATFSSFGVSLAGLGDVDGDGWEDFIVGASADDLVGANSGRAFIYRGIVKQPEVGVAGPGNARLEMIGEPLATDGIADLRLLDAPASKPAFLIANLTQTPMAFKGGTLIPTAAGCFVLSLATDAQGRLTMAGIPGGLDDVSVYIQLAIADPTQPSGVALSNAVLAEFLP